MGKSGSTFLATAIAALPDMRKVILVPGHGRREQELDTAFLARYSLKPYVAQHHIRYSQATGSLIRQFRITPIVLTRNLFDAVASNRDHIRTSQAPTAWLTVEQAAALTDSELEEFIAEFGMPWYVQFFVSWLDCPDALWIDYEDLRQNPKDVVARIARHAGIDAGDAAVGAAVAAAESDAPRFNKGVSGRGAKISPVAHDHIRRLASRYPQINFKRVL